MTTDSASQRKPRSASITAAARPGRRTGPRPRSEAKRQKIIDAATRHFAQKGYGAVRVEDIARELGIAKGSIFQHFKSKDGLFVAVYKKVVTGLPKWLDVPPEIRDKGFFPVIDYWFAWTRTLPEETRVRERIKLMGAFWADLPIKREIARFQASHDPFGMAEFVRFGVGRGEVRSDIEPEMIGWLLAWVWERFQRDMLAEETSRGIFRVREGKPGEVDARIETFMQMLRGALQKR
jgi:AcrR family transcriptional regulator